MLSEIYIPGFTVTSLLLTAIICLVAVLVALGGVHRRRKAVRQMEKEYEKAREETLADQVFYQQVRKREEEPVVIDAEFTPVEEEKQEQAAHGSNR